VTVARRNFMLFILTMVGVCSSTDRAIVSTVIEPIKQEFALTDSQLGLFAGFAFSITYGLVALPAGAIADRINRRKLMAGALAFWTVLTMSTGLAQTYILLLIARMGVGAGEAAGQPAVMSSVADLFPPERRSTAISIYYLSAPASLLLAGAVGGLITAAYGWRMAMAAVAAPGLVLSVVLLFCPDVPRPVLSATGGVSDGRAPSFGEVLRFIAGQRAVLHLIAAVALVNVVIAGLGAFGFAFFMRYHGMSLAELGPIYGIAAAGISLVVILASGVVADRVGRRDPRRRLWLIGGVIVVASPVVIAGCLAPQPFALVFYLFNLLIVGVWMGPATATVQNLTRPQMRSTMAAILFVTMGVIGVGLGPVFTGVLSDVWAARTGADGLRPALIITTAVGFWSALHFFLATRTLEEDLVRASE
jgi:MFS family permease